MMLMLQSLIVFIVRVVRLVGSVRSALVIIIVIHETVGTRTTITIATTVLVGARRASVHLVRRFALLVFFHFHATVLEPDFYLTFGEMEDGGELDASRPAQVTGEMKLFF